MLIKRRVIPDYKHFDSGNENYSSSRHARLKILWALRPSRFDFGWSYINPYFIIGNFTRVIVK
jgi:hypothetical protein